MTWDDQFLQLFHRCTGLYQNGNRDFETYYTPGDHDFLISIGYKPREFFDFIEDYCEDGTPSPSTALLIAAARRDYLHVHPETATPSRLLTRDDIPTFGHELNGIAYLPRILAKARAKLRGELDPDLMFGCGGDRRFLQTHGQIHPADFLRRVWSHHDDDQAIARWITSQSERGL
jgi:hypothetical protein